MSTCLIARVSRLGVGELAVLAVCFSHYQQLSVFSRRLEAMAHGTGSSRDGDDVHQDATDPELIATLLPTLCSLIQESV